MSDKDGVAQVIGSIGSVTVPQVTGSVHFVIQKDNRFLSYKDESGPPNWNSNLELAEEYATREHAQRIVDTNAVEGATLDRAIVREVTVVYKLTPL